MAEHSVHVEVGIALYCRAGKHRSVAGGIILRHILGAEGWSGGLRHLSRESWARHCCHGRCAACLAGPPALQAALGAAHDMWRQA